MSRNTKGFTLIELLIVVVIIGILAAIAIPKFASTKEKAYIASMKSDLRNLATAQEAWIADQNPPAYFAGAAITNIAPQVDANGAVIFAPSTGVSVAVNAVAGGWSATATHTQTNVQCGIFAGQGGPNPVGGGNIEGEPVCQ
jgi:prepilin-type N-terminal cleavage/methylation domain-containing protein